MKSKSFEQGCKIEIEIKSCLRRQKPSNKTRMFSFRHNVSTKQTQTGLKTKRIKTKQTWKTQIS